jgi:predicted RNA binding protein YcfA (HicA-like mRNA interferase family)
VAIARNIAVEFVRTGTSWDNEDGAPGTENCRAAHGGLGIERLVKIRDIVKMLEADGWSVVRQRGSHRQFKHATKPGLVTVAGKPGDDLAPGTLNSILRQAGVKP